MSFPEFNQNQKLALYVLIGLSAIGLSVAQVRNSFRGYEQVVLKEPGEVGEPSVVATDSDRMPSTKLPPYSGKVVFQVAGCVWRPGVYSLPEGNRVVDALKAAGGAKPHADTESINLAAKITDGSRIYVPAKSETQHGVPISVAAGAAISSVRSRSGPAESSTVATAPEGGPVNINTAGPEELDRIPGVGPSIAQRIIEYRNQIGRFTSVEQLMDVKGIGPKNLEKMKPYVAL
ncbi:MAG: helix-hairpin-helix domain-containing protein [Armatimonadetes bacterium]|nr:helix-hairpin-helix domain-containing protein [Armatimonadota bacterium]